LLRCFAECPTLDVLAAIGLSLSDLFPKSLGEFKSFQRINEEIKARQRPKGNRDNILLAVYQSDRDAGKRFNAQELELEKQAFLRMRRATA